MRYLGIDYGAKRIGVAFSSEGVAFPHSVVPNDASLLSVLTDIISKEKVSHVVVGDTRSFGGRENPITKDAENFIETLKTKTGLPVAIGWEAGSSVEASRHAPHERKRDAAAAALILQRYLDMRSGGVG